MVDKTVTAPCSRSWKRGISLTEMLSEPLETGPIEPLLAAAAGATARSSEKPSAKNAGTVRVDRMNCLTRIHQICSIAQAAVERQESVAPILGQRRIPRAALTRSNTG